MLENITELEMLFLKREIAKDSLADCEKQCEDYMNVEVKDLRVAIETHNYTLCVYGHIGTFSFAVYQWTKMERVNTIKVDGLKIVEIDVEVDEKIVEIVQNWIDVYQSEKV